METESVLKAIAKLRYDYMYNQRRCPKTLFISKSMTDILRIDYGWTVGLPLGDGFSILGMKVYEVYQEDVMKVTD